MHCNWFHVFDFVGQLQWLGLRSCRVPRRCWSIWGLVVSLGNNSGLWQRTTWYRLLLLPSTRWRPVTWWKDVRFGFRFGFAGSNPEGNFLRFAVFLSFSTVLVGAASRSRRSPSGLLCDASRICVRPLFERNRVKAYDASSRGAGGGDSEGVVYTLYSLDTSCRCL